MDTVGESVTVARCFTVGLIIIKYSLLYIYWLSEWLAKKFLEPWSSLAHQVE